MKKKSKNLLNFGNLLIFSWTWNLQRLLFLKNNLKARKKVRFCALNGMLKIHLCLLATLMLQFKYFIYILMKNLFIYVKILLNIILSIFELKNKHTEIWQNLP